MMLKSFLLVAGASVVAASDEPKLIADPRFEEWSRPKWDAANLLIDEAQKELLDGIAKIPTYPEDEYSERGIVMVTGAKNIKDAMVNIAMIRGFGCKLRIQVWHLDHAIPLESRGFFTEYSVESYNIHDFGVVNNVQAFGGAKKSSLTTIPLLHTELEEVLLLDGNTVPTRDPTFLFDDEQYTKTGSVFWPDYWKTHPANPIWDITGIDANDDVEFAKGQMLINKKKAWKAINTCDLMQKKLFYTLLNGDKDIYRFAWKLAGADFAVAPQAAAVGFVAHSTNVAEGERPPFCSHSMGQFGFDGEILFLRHIRINLMPDLDRQRYITHTKQAVGTPHWHQATVGKDRVKCVDFLVSKGEEPVSATLTPGLGKWEDTYLQTFEAIESSLPLSKAELRRRRDSNSPIETVVNTIAGGNAPFAGFSDAVVGAQCNPDDDVLIIQAQVRLGGYYTGEGSDLRLTMNLAGSCDNIGQASQLSQLEQAFGNFVVSWDVGTLADPDFEYSGSGEELPSLIKDGIYVEALCTDDSGPAVLSVETGVLQLCSKDPSREQTLNLNDVCDGLKGKSFRATIYAENKMPMTVVFDQVTCARIKASQVTSDFVTDAQPLPLPSLNKECQPGTNDAELNAWLNIHGGISANGACTSTGSSWVTTPAAPSLAQYTGTKCAKDINVGFTATDACGSSASTAPLKFSIQDTVGPRLVQSPKKARTECTADTQSKFATWVGDYGGMKADDDCFPSPPPCPEEVTLTLSDGACPFCEDTYDPVCTFDGDEYVNSCHAVCQGLNKIQWKTGPCIATTTVAPASCGFCGSVVEPVCVNDDQQFTNACQAFCRGHKSFTTGICKPMNAVTGKTCSHCESHGNGGGFVCGSDGITYDSPCHAACNGIYSYYHGECSVSSEACGPSPLAWSSEYDPDWYLNRDSCLTKVPVTFKAEDPCGNTIEGSSEFEVVDSEPPTITAGAGDVLVECDASGNLQDLQNYLATYGGAKVDDACGALPTLWTEIKGPEPDQICPSTQTYTFIASDACENAAYTTGRISIVDTTPPVFKKKAEVRNVECNAATNNRADFEDYIQSFGNAVAIDECNWGNGVDSSLVMEYPDVPYDFKPTKCVERRNFGFGVRDTCGLVATTTGRVVITDSKAPIITSQPLAVTTVNKDSDTDTKLREWLDTQGGAVAMDECNHGATWSYNGQPALPTLIKNVNEDCTDEISIVFTATDSCGNMVYTNPATFRAIDATPPTLTVAENKIVECKENGNDKQYDAWEAGMGGATCSDAGATAVPKLTASEPSWTTPNPACSNKIASATYTCTDECGLVSTATTSFSVTDTTPPILLQSPTAFNQYCDGRCTDYAKQQSDAKMLFEKWTNVEHGCMAGEDDCNTVIWSYVATPSTGTFNINSLCGTSGKVTFTATDSCGNSDSTIASYNFPEIDPPPIAIQPPPFAALPTQIAPIQTPCDVCADASGKVMSLRRMRRLTYRWEGTSGVKLTVGSEHTLVSRDTLFWGDLVTIELMDTAANYKVMSKLVVTSTLPTGNMNVAENFPRKCMGPGLVVGSKVNFLNIGNMVLVGWQTKGGATERECPGGEPPLSYVYPALGEVLEWGCCFKFTTGNNVLERFDYMDKPAGGFCPSYNEPDGGGTRGQRFDVAIGCSNLRTAHVAEAAAQANLRDVDHSPQSCGKGVGLTDVCIAGRPPQDIIDGEVTEEIEFSDEAFGCCYTQRSSLATGITIFEGHVDAVAVNCKAPKTFARKASCGSVKKTQQKATNGALQYTDGCCFVRQLSATGLSFYDFQDTKARNCAVTETAEAVMNAFEPKTCAEVQLLHGQAVNPLAPTGQIPTEDNCEADMCEMMQSFTGKGINKVKVLKLKFTMNTNEVFSHSSTWKQAKEAIYRPTSSKTHLVKISGKGGVIYKKKVKDGDVFEISQGAAGFKGTFLKVQIGVGKFKAQNKIGIDCKKGREVKIGDQWGVITIIGYELKKGEKCSALSATKETAMFVEDPGPTQSGEGGSTGSESNHQALKIVAAFAGIVLVAATIIAVRAVHTIEENPNDTLIGDYVDDAQIASSVSSKSTNPIGDRAGTRWTMTGNTQVQAPEDEVLDVGTQRRIDGV